jgi:hypothetical protein
MQLATPYQCLRNLAMWSTTCLHASLLPSAGSGFRALGANRLKPHALPHAQGNVIPTGEFPWRWTLCGWSLAFANPQILVIQDTLQVPHAQPDYHVTR